MRVFPPVGFSFCLCVSLHLAVLSGSFILPSSLVSSQSIDSSVSSSPSRAVSLTISVLLSACFLFPVLAVGGCAGVWAAFRPPAGRPGSALLPGCCWRSTQAFCHSPSLAAKGSPSTPQASQCPRFPAPPQQCRPLESFYCS